MFFSSSLEFSDTLWKNGPLSDQITLREEPRVEIRSFPWKPAFPDENGDMEVKTSGCHRNRAHVSHVHQVPPSLS
ncbi:uncharacterized [Tachysurus ichikawai]